MSKSDSTRKLVENLQNFTTYTIIWIGETRPKIDNFLQINSDIQNTKKKSHLGRRRGTSISHPPPAHLPRGPFAVQPIRKPRIPHGAALQSEGFLWSVQKLSCGQPLVRAMGSTKKETIYLFHHSSRCVTRACATGPGTISK
jgi:hypothetical protein